MKLDLTVDGTKFNRSMAQLYAVAQKDSTQFIMEQTKLLARECGEIVGPASLSAGKKKTDADVAHFTYPKPKENVDQAQVAQGGGFRWLYAGPRYLVGTAHEDYLPEHGGMKGVLRTLNKEKDNPRGGRRWVNSGVHGKQTVWQINKPVITRKERRDLITELARRIGRLKASFFQTAKNLGETRIPAWVSRHFPSKKSIFDLSGLRVQDNPNITFGSNATGCTRNLNVFKQAVTNRTAKMTVQAKNIVKYWKKKLEAGENLTPSQAAIGRMT